MEHSIDEVLWSWGFRIADSKSWDSPATHSVICRSSEEIQYEGTLDTIWAWLRSSGRGERRAMARIQCYIPADIEDQEVLTVEEAEAEIAHLRALHPENIYEVVDVDDS